MKKVYFGDETFQIPSIPERKTNIAFEEFLSIRLQEVSDLGFSVQIIKLFYFRKNQDKIHSTNALHEV